MAVAAAAAAAHGEEAVAGAIDVSPGDAGEVAHPVCGASDCGRLGTKLCSRCGQASYCSGECQRKAWPAHKLRCLKADSPDAGIRALLKEGKVYSARERLRQLERPSAKLKAELEEALAFGIHSEIVGGAIRVERVGDMGLGYIAARDLRPEELLLFDTAFLTAPCDSGKAPHFLMAEKLAKRLSGDARRRSAKADAQADFFYDKVKELPLKGNMDRASLETAGLEDDVKEQMLVCSIVEGSALYCSDEPNYMALFPAAAYFNHSCAPNAVVESSRAALTVRASECVAAGEEVLISYLPPQVLEEPVGKRRARLEGGRGFVCACRRCLAEGEASGGSDEAATGDDPSAPLVLEPGSKPMVIRKDLL